MDLANFSAYTVGEFDTGIFLSKFKEMNFFLIQELEACSYNEFLISLDAMVSNLPMAVAAGLNLITQAGTGIADSDAVSSGSTSLYKAYDIFAQAGDHNDENEFWRYSGQAFQLLLSQLLKVAAGDQDIEV